MKKKDENKEFIIIYCRRCVLVIQKHISGNMYNELYSESSEEKCMVFQSIAWSLFVHKNTIKNCSTVLQAFSSQTLSLFVSFISFFIKARILLQFLSQAFIILSMFSPFSFVFINALITYTYAKISLKIHLCTETCFFIFLLPRRKGFVSFSLK